MRIIACIDDNCGMMFNRRRQSRDKLLTADVIEMTKSHKLWMNEYSAQLFEEESVIIKDDFLQQAQDDDFCFVENQSVQPYLAKVEEVVLYRWNRKYPADFYFDLDMDEWKLVDEKEFTGSSHEKITRERYIKEEEQ